MYRVIRGKFSKKNLLVGVFIFSVIIFVAFFAYFRLQDRDKVVTGELDTPGTEKIDLSPPSEEDKLEAERNKEKLIEDSQRTPSQLPPASTNDNRAAVTPSLGFLRQADDGNIEANGYITEAIEDNGTCTLIVKKDGKEISATKQAMPDAQSTICGLIVIERSKLTAGEWKATIIYSSPKYYGMSEERIIKVE